MMLYAQRPADVSIETSVLRSTPFDALA
jgi:hypothetical protein